MTMFISILDFNICISVPSSDDVKNFPVKANDTVDSVKSKLAIRLKMSASVFGLQFSPQDTPQTLVGSSTMHDCGVQPGSTLELIFTSLCFLVNFIFLLSYENKTHMPI